VATLPLDVTTGIAHVVRYRLVIQTPARGPAIRAVDGRDVFTAPTLVSIAVPAKTVLVLELEPADGVPSTAAPDEAVDPTRIPTPVIPLDGWVDDTGRPMPFPGHRAMTDVRLRTSVRIARGTLDLLRSRRGHDAASLERVVGRWRAAGFPDPFAGACPDRLLLIVPFQDADEVGDLGLSVAGHEVPIAAFRIDPPGDTRLSGEPLPGRLRPMTVCWWADVTDAVDEGIEQAIELTIGRMAADQFLGPWLEIPGLDHDPAHPRIVCRGRTGPAWSTGDTDARQPDRVHAQAGPGIESAWWTPATLREGVLATIHARVAHDAGALAGVYCSTLVGPGVFTDVALSRDADGTWSHGWLVGDRREVILDPAASHLWAVDQDGRVGPTRSIAMQWGLRPRDRDRDLTNGGEVHG
jgi:hypothetical protein